MESAKLAILILNWNGIEETVACVDSLLKEQGEFVVRILDNGSNNKQEYASISERYKADNRVVVFRSENNLGFTGGCNFLIKKVMEERYPYVMLLNNDTIVKEGFVERLLSSLKNRIGIFGPEVRYYSNPDLLQSVGGNVNLFTGVCSRVGDKQNADSFTQKNIERVTDYIFGCAFIISREVIEKIGLLHEDYFAYFEEVDYCLLAKKNNFDIRYLSVETVFHKDSITAKKMSGFHIYMMFRNRIIFLRRQANLLQYLASFIYLATYLPYFALKYGLKEAKELLIGTFDGVKGKTGNPFLYRTF